MYVFSNLISGNTRSLSTREHHQKWFFSCNFVSRHFWSFILLSLSLCLFNALFISFENHSHKNESNFIEISALINTVCLIYRTQIVYSLFLPNEGADWIGRVSVNQSNSHHLYTPKKTKSGILLLP